MEYQTGERKTPELTVDSIDIRKNTMTVKTNKSLTWLLAMYAGGGTTVN